jgi:hypothetical protein
MRTTEIFSEKPACPPRPSLTLTLTVEMPSVAGEVHVGLAVVALARVPPVAVQA